MSKKLSTFAPLLGYFFLLVGALFVGMVQGQTCGNNECKPWSSPSCKRGNQIPMVFQLANQEDPNYLPVNFSSRNVSLGPSVAAFPYCAEVDQLQAFLLYDAITAANSLPINTNQSGGLSMSYLSLRGTGPYQDTNAPTMDQSAVAPFVVWNAASLGCTGQQPIAVARFLIFNITMTNGIYKLGGDGGVPIQTGFDPTCDGNTCLLDDGFCIGTTGAKNCARCYDLATGVKPNVTVFAAYYGTDNSGRSFKSGSLNPLNFEQFAWQPVYKSVSDGVLG